MKRLKPQLSCVHSTSQSQSQFFSSFFLRSVAVVTGSCCRRRCRRRCCWYSFVSRFFSIWFRRPRKCFHARACFLYFCCCCHCSTFNKWCSDMGRVHPSSYTDIRSTTTTIDNRIRNQCKTMSVSRHIQPFHINKYIYAYTQIDYVRCYCMQISQNENPSKQTKNPNRTEHKKKIGMRETRESNSYIWLSMVFGVS